MPQHSPHPALARGCVLFFLAVFGCGGDGSTSPNTAVPQVAGAYNITEVVPAATCTPNQPPDGGTVIVSAFSQTYPVIIEQHGTVVTLNEPGALPSERETGAIDANGKIKLDAHWVFQEPPRAGNRTFIVDLTAHRDLQVQPSGQITGTGSFVNVFHEGVVTAPVFTICSRQGTTMTLNRT